MTGLKIPYEFSSPSTGHCYSKWREVNTDEQVMDEVGRKWGWVTVNRQTYHGEGITDDRTGVTGT